MSVEKDDLSVPSPSSRDQGYAVIRAAISAIPVAGGPVVELLGVLVTPEIEKRRNDWMSTVSEKLLALEKERKIDLATLASKPEFIDAVLVASRIALRTSRAEKLEALRNAVLNSALHAESSAIIQEILFNLIDGMTPMHLQFLQHFGGIKGSTTISTDGFASCFPELKDSALLYRTIWKDLRDRGLIESDAPIPSENLRIITIKVSELGLSLMRFITAPA